MRILPGIAFSGGASRALNYFQILKEMGEKSIRASQYTGCSGGGIFAALAACGYTAYEAMLMLNRIKGDSVMKMICKAETETNKFKQIAYGVAGGVMRWIPNLSIANTFHKFLRWELLEDNTYLQLGVCDEEDVLRVLGKELFDEIKGLGIGKVLSEGALATLNRFKSGDVLRRIPIYYFSNHGISRNVFDGSEYRVFPYDANTNSLADVVMGTFANPLLNPVYLSVGKKIIKAFDGGFVDNYAVVPLRRNGLAVTCRYEFARGDEKDFIDRTNGLSLAVVKRTNRIMQAVCSSDVEYKGFYGFYNANIDEYYKLPASDIFMKNDEICDDRR